MFVQEQPVVYQSFPDAVVTRDDGEEAAIEAILPTKVPTHLNHNKNKINISDAIKPTQLPSPFKKGFQAYFCG
jgi:hypothetical protein